MRRFVRNDFVKNSIFFFQNNNLKFLSSNIKGVSRKRKKHAPNLDLEHFNEQGPMILKEIESAVSVMVNLNPVFKIEKKPNELSVDTGEKGKYTFSLNYNTLKLTVASPMSGNFNYRYDSDSGYWLGTQDGHDMRGLVTRDMIRHCTGMPKFK